MEEGQLWENDKRQTKEVDGKVQAVMPGVEAGQDEEEDGYDGQEFASGRILDPIVQLLPVGQATAGALINRDPWMGLHLSFEKNA